MRVITGVAKGRRLITLEGADVVRPTSEKVKEAIFSAIQFDIEGRRVLDLFGGSGQLGIEALSRGAQSAVFVDASRDAVKVIKQNLASTGLNSVAEVFNCDYSSFLARCTKSFDIIFLDPPYKSGVLVDALEKSVKVLSDFGTVFCEHPINSDLPENVGACSVKKTYKFGSIAVTMYKKDINNE